MRVNKRDGRWVQWDRQLIVRAMLMAFHDVGKEIQREEVEDLASQVEDCVGKLYGGDAHVEQIQDTVEQVLMAKHGDIAKAYILFREKRAQLRASRLTPDPECLQNYIHAAKYARWRGDLGRRETFAETVNRVKGMHLERYRMPLENNKEFRAELDRAFDQVLARNVLPSMRSMQFGGPPVLARNIRLYNCAFSHADRLRFFGEIFWVLLGGSGAGFSVQHHHVEQLPPVIRMDPRRVSHFVIPDSCMGWADSVNHLVRCAFVTGEWPEFAYNEIRSEGADLSSGGKAPGHLGLKKGLEAFRSILVKAVGRRLRPIEVFDAVCHLADAVLSGGVRRSSLICLFSLDDTEMMLAKAHGNFRPLGHPEGTHNAWRANANISAVCHRENTTWDQFRRLVSLAKEWGEPGFYFTRDLDYGCNPCGEIGKMPRLYRRKPGADRTLDFDWKAYRSLQRDCRSRGVPDRPFSDGNEGKDWAVKTYGHTSGWQFCNLCEINVAACKDEAELMEAARAAATIGTLQAGFADFWYLGPVTEEIVRREALLGVGMTGMQDNPALAFDPRIQQRAAELVKYQNEVVAGWIGINTAARSTTVKPSGTASLELGCVGSGIHPHHARRYFRRVTANPNEAPFLHFRKANPHMCQRKPNGDWVILFPVQAPTDANTVKQTPASEFMEQVFSTFENWVVPGTRMDREDLNPGLRHNVSCTVAYDPDEWDEVMMLAWQNRHRVTAMTFLANYNDKAFPFAPREEVKTAADETLWRNLIALYRPVDWMAAHEREDGTAFAAACEGLLCETEELTK